jgi:methanogenic corrinoid protein MtbC1
MPQATDFHGHEFGPQRTSRHLERLLQLLMNGDRVGCRDLLREYLDDGRDASEALRQLLWPACAMIDTLARRDQIGAVAEHCATVLLTQLTQRMECGLAKHPARCRTILVTTGPKATEELAGEIFAGLAEADGFDVTFLGGGVESDDLFAEIGNRQPTFVVSFAASGPDAPRLRRLLAALRAQEPVPGLSEEIGADFEADSPFEMLEAVRNLVNTPSAHHQRRSRAA